MDRLMYEALAQILSNQVLLLQIVGSRDPDWVAGVQHALNNSKPIEAELAKEARAK